MQAVEQAAVAAMAEKCQPRPQCHLKRPDADLKKLNHGLWMDGKPLLRAQMRWQNEDQLSFPLKEGRKRQIRRMRDMVGFKVLGLKRVCIGKVKLGDLPQGRWR